MLVKRRDNSDHRDAALLVSARLYRVYAVLLDATPKFLVSEERSLSFPFFVSERAVELIDARLSTDMHFSPALSSTEECSSRAPMIGFFEIVTDRSFYQNLVDGEEEATRVWRNIQAKDDEPSRGEAP